MVFESCMNLDFAPMLTIKFASKQGGKGYKVKAESEIRTVPLRQNELNGPRVAHKRSLEQVLLRHVQVDFFDEQLAGN